jgi:nucleotide-binding universal stress UspA family protein
MTSPVLLCADGSDHSRAALAAGTALLAPGTPLVIVTVEIEPDASLVTGTGMAGGVVSPEAFDQMEADSAAEAIAVVEHTRAALGLPDAEGRVLRGDPGPAICRLAEELDAQAIVIGSRGRGGFKRAVLGSVSDHVVRHAPCTVMVTGPKATDHDG